jgi:hypothetical protein
MKELFDGLRVLAKALGATNYPKATAVIVAILTGIVCYKLLIYLREEQPGDAVPRTTITNTTSGKQSPIMPDNNGTVTITNGSSNDKPKGHRRPNESPRTAIVCLFPYLLFAQQTNNSTSGPCSPIPSNNQGVINIRCSGFTQEQGAILGTLPGIMNKILANQLDPKVVMAKLDEILANQKTTGSCDRRNTIQDMEEIE